VEQVTGKQDHVNLAVDLARNQLSLFPQSPQPYIFGLRQAHDFVE
jgi:hypothetical protein